MSDYEAYTGKLIPTGKTFEVFVEEVGLEKDPWCDSLEEAFREKYEDVYLLVEDYIYKFDMEEIDPNELISITPNTDGSISFTVSYYNGGTCLDEVLTEGLLNLPLNKEPKKYYVLTYREDSSSMGGSSQIHIKGVTTDKKVAEEWEQRDCEYFYKETLDITSVSI